MKSLKNILPKSNKFFAYIRVSTRKQEDGASLDEQQRQIDNYAEEKKLTIVKKFEEKQSAAKIGRVHFSKMVKELEKDKSIRGVIFHTVDRSARNPYDQAKLYQLKQAGYELHFAHDKIDSTNHSAMSMIFIRWGIASYFSENLKVETKKGIMGRLHEGKFPGKAPLGYLDKKEAEKIGYKDLESGVKIVDPIRGKLVKKAFELYSTGEHTIKNLNKIMGSLGLTNKVNKPLNWKMLYRVLRNPFYHGTILHNGEEFEGKFHKPLVTKTLFDRVQLVIEGKANKFKKSHFYLFQGLVKCGTCGKAMRSQTAKGKYKYFYCRKEDCGYGNSAQHSELEELFERKLKAISFQNSEIEGFREALKSIRNELFVDKDMEKKALGFEITKLETRLNNLLNQMLDNQLPDNIYKDKKNELLNSITLLKEKEMALDEADAKSLSYFEELGKLLKNPILLYKMMDFEQRRNFLKSMVENFSWNEGKLYLVWKKPFDLVAERPISADCSPGGI